MLPAPLPPPVGAPLPGPPPDATTQAERRARAIGQAATTAAVLGGGLVALRTLGIHAPGCPFRTMTGIPCPGCGITRLADATVHGRIHLALGADPAGVALLAAIMVVAVGYTVATVVLRRPVPRWLEHGAIPIVFLALLGAHWATTLLTGTLPSG